MKTSLYLIMAAVMIFVFNACEEKKDDPAPNSSSSNGAQNKVVNIKVIDRYRQQQGSTIVNKDSLLPGAIVRLYKTESDMNNNNL